MALPEEINYEVLDIATSEQKEAINNIEKLAIGPAQRVALILVELGVKPTTEVDIFPWNDKPTKVEEVMRKAKLFYQEKSRQDTKDGGQNIEYVVAKDKENLEKLLHVNPDKDHEEYGRLMGYPDTAVKAFLKGNARSTKDFTNENMAVDFFMSPDNWQEELKLIRYWNSLLKKYAPKTYTQLMPIEE